jgi:Domain of unknown function (DUF3943)
MICLFGLFGTLVFAGEGLDSLGAVDSLRKPSYFRPAVEIVAANMAMGAFNRYVRQVEYAQVEPETVWHNLAHEWVWDDNNFTVNQIGHPLQGGMYYSLARANGQGYLGSLAYTTLGSIHWEYFMETEPPAINDLITTRMGGAMIGEVCWRMAEYVSGESTGENTGWLRKSGAFLINPIFGMDRLVNGTPARKGPLSPQRLMGARISTGRTLAKGYTHRSGAASEPSTQLPLANTNILVIHGDPFESKHPFDHFTLNLGASVRASPVANVSLRGELWKFDLPETDNFRQIVQFAQNYDYLNSSIYRVSANSLGVEWLSETRFGGDWMMLARIQPNFIALGAASTEYYLNVERDYNLGMGGGWKASVMLRKPGAWLFSAQSDRYWIHTASGAKGDEVIDIHTIEIQRDIWKALGMSVAYLVYDRYGYYDAHRDVGIVNQEFRVSATITL